MSHMITIAARSLCLIKSVIANDGENVEVGQNIFEISYIDLERQAKALERQIESDEDELNNTTQQYSSEKAIHDSAVEVADAYSKYLKAVHDIYKEGLDKAGTISKRTDLLQIEAESIEAAHRLKEKIFMRDDYVNDHLLVLERLNGALEDKKLLLSILRQQVSNKTIVAPCSGTLKLSCAAQEIIPFGQSIAVILV